MAKSRVVLCAFALLSSAPTAQAEWDVWYEDKACTLSDDMRSYSHGNLWREADYYGSPLADGFTSMGDCQKYCDETGRPWMMFGIEGVNEGKCWCGNVCLGPEEHTGAKVYFNGPKPHNDQALANCEAHFNYDECFKRCVDEADGLAHHQENWLQGAKTCISPFPRKVMKCQEQCARQLQSDKKLGNGRLLKEEGMESEMPHTERGTMFLTFIAVSGWGAFIVHFAVVSFRRARSSTLELSTPAEHDLE